jgi:hypothetical protein
MKMGRIVLFLLGLGAVGSIALAQTPGTFTTTGNMITARRGHTSTLLADGRVLIAGGDTIDRALAPPFKTQSSAEIYDPRSGTFTATGNMTTPRSGHTAILLADGRVLIAGGGVTNPAQGKSLEPMGSAELYDPDTGTFTATANMTMFRTGQSATLLTNGKVLIAGGSGGRPDSAELYNPFAGTFSATGDMTNWRADTATLLPNGRVFITRGDSDDGRGSVSSADLYDPSTGTFTFAGYTIINNPGPTATLLMNGKVLRIAGGDIGDTFGASNMAELYDPTTGAFSTTGNMTTLRKQDTATLLSDGMALIAGDGGTSAELYNFATSSFSGTGGMNTPRFLHTATLLNDGRVLIAGGVVGSEYPLPILSSAEIYTPSVPVPAPALLSLSGDGQGQGAIQHAGTTRIASADDPAVPGEYLSIYLNGLADGSVIPPQVAIGGRLAEITFFGNVPGYPGLNVVNVRMPSGVAPGPAVSVRLTYLSRPSNQVTIGVAPDAALQQAVTAMKTAAGTDSLNFWEWAWYWQYLPPFTGAPAGFGVIGSISPDVMEQIILAGGGDPLRDVSAEQWVVHFRQAVPQ